MEQFNTLVAWNIKGSMDIKGVVIMVGVIASKELHVLLPLAVQLRC